MDVLWGTKQENDLSYCTQHIIILRHRKPYSFSLVIILLSYFIIEVHEKNSTDISLYILMNYYTAVAITSKLKTYWIT